MEQPKVSIIVPIYGVEPYLRRCLDSILGQTYPNLQIILVDDGSPDNCGLICDEYARMDPRVQVVHQPNKGVAAARNAGLAMADGEWIGWVDADDWIDPDMFAFLLEGALRTKSDVCICGRYEQLRHKTAYFGASEPISLDRKAAVAALLEERYIDSALYDKLWKRALFDGIVFPQGHTYEDLATVYRLFERSERTQCLPGPKYHYFRRKGSITGNSGLENRMEHYLAAQRRQEAMAEKWPELAPLLEQRCITAAIGLWVACAHVSKAQRQPYAARLSDIAQFCKSLTSAALTDTSCGLAGRLIIRLLPYDRSWAYWLAGCIGWLYQHKHGRML